MRIGMDSMLGELGNSTSLYDISTESVSSRIQPGHDSTADMFATLLQIFLTIKLGWLAGFFKIIDPEQAKGLNIFVAKFSLPVLIFVSLATLDFSEVDWSFLIAITITKSAIFLFVAGVEFFISSRDPSRAVIFAIFCTQTNDFGMGLPILESVYGPEHKFVGLLYLVAPISLLILNPIGFLILEAEKTKKKKAESEGQGKLKTVSKVIRGLLLNPIVTMTFLGICANFVFSRSIPESLLKFLNAIGSAFTSMAPFTLGLSIVGKLANIRGGNMKPIIGLLVVKSIATPLLTHIVVEQTARYFNGETDRALANYGVLYGSMPPALGVDSYAALYGISPELISASIVITTIASAPLMYLSANILTVFDLENAVFISNLQAFSYNISIISIIGSILILMIFLMSGRFRWIPHLLTTSLLLYSIEAAVGGLLWSNLRKDAPLWLKYLQTSLNNHGIYSSKLCVVTISASLCLLVARNDRGQRLQRFKFPLLLVSPIIGGVITLVLSLTQDLHYKLESPFGTVQDMLNAVLDLICFICLVVFLARKHRLEYRNLHDEKPHFPKCEAENSDEDSEAGKSGEVKYSPQIFRHTLVLLLYLGAMFSNMTLSGFRLCNVFQSSNPGLYQVLVYIDSFLWTGQGLLLVSVFALDCKFILLPVSRAFKWLLTKIGQGETYVLSLGMGNVRMDTNL